MLGVEEIDIICWGWKRGWDANDFSEPVTGATLPLGVSLIFKLIDVFGIHQESL